MLGVLVFASGEKSYHGGITKRGDRYLRKQLIHGARSVVNWVNRKNDELSEWVKRLIVRRGYNKAVVALAHKLARIAWAVLNKQQPYAIQ